MNQTHRKNMRVLTSLFKTDLLAIRHWFHLQTVSKLLVLGAFFILFSGVALVIYRFSQLFFLSLTDYAEYGRLTAVYILHAAILILGWFGLGSSIASTFSYLLSGNKNLRYLLQLPVNPAVIVVWIFGRATFISAVLLIITIAPLGLAFHQVFNGSWDVLFTFRLILVLLLLIYLATGLGSLMGIILSRIFSRFRLWAVLATTVCFCTVTVLLIQMIFPPQIYSLAETASFLQVYKHLPLVNPLLPTSWLTNTLTGSINEQTFFALLWIGAIILGSLAVQTYLFTPAWQQINSCSNRRRPLYFRPVKFIQPLTLVQKEWLSLIRRPQEFGYGLFLMGMVVLFFLLLDRVYVTRLASYGLTTEITLFSFGWLCLYITALLLRIVFPLMSREGSSAWYIFTQPLERKQILGNQLLFGVVLTLPFLVLTVGIWLTLPFVTNYRPVLIGITWWTITLLTLGHGLIGSIRPQFSLSHDPEKVSTSIMGLVALFYSLALTITVGWGVSKILNNLRTPNQIIGPGIFSSIALLMFLFLLARFFLKKYEF